MSQIGRSVDAGSQTGGREERRVVPMRGGALQGLRAEPGVVWLVGAGPGDPELLTVKAMKVLARADVIVHDRLVSADILELAPKSARRLYVGKRRSHHSLPQEDVNHLLTALARDGLCVVRLKGGDPFLFGRGGEELLACRAAGVRCVVVPGISAGVAAAAAAGAPLTHRGLAQSVTFVTGHAGDGAPELDWAALAAANSTLVVYMGLATCEIVAARLIAAGRSGETPVLVVENASRPQERRISGALKDLGAVCRDLTGPSVLIIGAVAALAQEDASEPLDLGSVDRLEAVR
jgi:uroporphyrin-III C-methyltransferase